MSISNKKRVVITERDEKLFHYLFFNKVATNCHLQRDIFSGSSKQAVHHRLDKLIKAGFIEATYLRETGNRLVYSLSKKSLLKFIGQSIDLKRMQRKSSSIAHDLELLEIKRALTNLRFVDDYFTENALIAGIFDDDEQEIQEIRVANPDAIVKVSVAKTSYFFPLEYEASAKFYKRYGQLIDRYYFMDEVKAVLFIAKNLSIQKKVAQVERKKHPGRSGKFFYCLYQNLIDLQEKAQFINNQKEVVLMN